MFDALGTRFTRRAAVGVLLAPGRYLTDGRRLFRVVSQFSPGEHQVLAALEDCRTLEVRPYGPDELYELGLTPVRPAG